LRFRMAKRLAWPFEIGLVALWSANSGTAALFATLSLVDEEKDERSFTEFYITGS
jgi:hypothetical protein